jgi:hypothetical protein
MFESACDGGATSCGVGREEFRIGDRLIVRGRLAVVVANISTAEYAPTLTPHTWAALVRGLVVQFHDGKLSPIRNSQVSIRLGVKSVAGELAARASSSPGFAALSSRGHPTPPH